MPGLSAGWSTAAMRILLVIGAALALTVTGCGTSSPGNGVASAGGTAAPSASASAAAASNDGRQFAQCMRDHGVNMPDPDPNGQIDKNAQVDRNSPAFRTAAEACKQFLPYGGDLSKMDP